MKNEMHFDEAQEALLGLLAHNLFGRPFTPPKDTDWSKVFREGYLQGVHLTAFSHCRDLDIPTDDLQKMKPMIGKYMLRDIHVAGCHTALHKLLSEADIPYCIIKGIASAKYYPDLSERSLGDVDFLIRSEDKDRVLAIMTEKGYEAREEEGSHHVVLENRNARFELHIEPPGMPHGEKYAYAKECMDSILEEAAAFNDQMVTCICPSGFHHGMILLMHTMHHMLGEGVGLRHICDWAVFLEYMGERFQDVFEKPLRRLGLWRFASILSLVSAQYLGATVRPWMPQTKEDKAIARGIMVDVFNGGNFGTKENERHYEGMFISDRGKSGIKGNRLKDGFRSLNEITRKKWPLTKRVPILLPIGWVVTSLGFFKRNKERKKQGNGVSVRKVYQKSLHRRKLFESLKIYESEDDL